MDTDRRARVFVSCDQKRGTDQVEVARELADSLRDLGFDPYVAIQEQTLRGVTENIFKQLESSEYFVFIDYKRDRIKKLGGYRGSLFSHQELAVAKFLDLPLIAFHEKGVLREGITGFIQANSTEFTDRKRLKKAIIKQVLEKMRGGKWSPESGNRLVLHRDATQYDDAINREGHTQRFFHVSVHNRHRRMAATNCYACLEEITAISGGENLFRKTVEVKWKGYMLPFANIRPGRSRAFDAVRIDHQMPEIGMPHVHTDFTPYSPPIIGPGEFLLRFIVTAEHFPTECINLKLRLGQDLSDAQLEEV